MTAKARETDIGVVSILLLALLERTSRRASKKDVHRLRTTVRRLEVRLTAAPSKIANSLKKLRKKAGKVRDLDVHLDLLQPPLLDGRKLSGAADSRLRPQAELRSILQKRRDRQRRALRALAKQSAPLLERRLPELIEGRTAPAVAVEHARQLASRARQRFLQMTKTIPEDEQRLHRLRIETKKLRYSLEPLQSFEQAAELAEKFRQVQDAIGDWHDWVTLEQLAQKRLRASDAAPVLAALHARVGREFRRCRRSAQSVRSWIMGSRPALPAATAAAGPRLVRKAG